ncbi:MAG TPA: TIGR01457 family HAD-type hydrolase [Anaerolineaceae bacterium]|nr:TIGR01457 family HAD-type hydrolase [Anaerolineaceae bacterium]
MDGVLVHGKKMVPGADKFIEKLREKGLKFLILTNNSIYTPIDLAHKLQTSGVSVSQNEIYTSAMATANFMKTQKASGNAFVIGESGLNLAIHDAGFILTPESADFVVLGETFDYNFRQVTKAVRLIMEGAHFLATNPDPSGPSDEGIVPACGAMASLIEKASGKSPFFCGKPNPFMMRSALNHLGVHSEDTVMIGDRMDTDIIAGLQSGMETILVLSGVTSMKDIEQFPYRPHRIASSVREIEI